MKSSSSSIANSSRNNNNNNINNGNSYSNQPAVVTQPSFASTAGTSLGTAQGSFLKRDYSSTGTANDLSRGDMISTINDTSKKNGGGTFTPS